MIGALARQAVELPEFPIWGAAPFVALLLSIAILPLVAKEWWHRNYPKVAAAFAAVVLTMLALRDDRETFGAPLLTRALLEYVSFIALVGSLFVVSAGVLVRVNAAGTTTVNVVLLAAGGVLANLVGTTGAAMLLIRPYLRMNRERFGGHHVPFFIFIVANCGGALTPIGDPPLFLGHLRGVPFFWTAERLATPWAFTLGALLLLFAVFDTIHARRGALPPKNAHASDRVGLEVSGARSLLFLFAIVGLVLVQNEPIVKDHAPVSTVIVAVLMLAVAAGAYLTADRRALAANEFTLEPIREVAILFAAIFTTMAPALAYFESHTRVLSVDTPSRLYFASGTLSSVLDNAPTYLTFLTTLLSRMGLSAHNPADVRAALATPEGALGIAAISCGAVFFGAMTYVGNGPNFMVKSIAESSGFRCPSFFGYVFRWSVPVLLPVLWLVAVFFFGAAA